MGQPIVLVGKDGRTVTVYGNAQAAELLAAGFSHLADQTDNEVEDAPAPAKGKPSKKPATGKE